MFTKYKLTVLYHGQNENDEYLIPLVKQSDNRGKLIEDLLADLSQLSALYTIDCDGNGLKVNLDQCLTYTITVE